MRSGTSHYKGPVCVSPPILSSAGSSQIMSVKNIISQTYLYIPTTDNEWERICALRIQVLIPAFIEMLMWLYLQTA